MLYFRCPTCQTVLADKQILYEKGVDKINDNTKLSSTQKKQESKKLLDKLYVVRICCRMRMLTYSQPIKFIN